MALWLVYVGLFLLLEQCAIPAVTDYKFILIPCEKNDSRLFLFGQ